MTQNNAQDRENSMPHADLVYSMAALDPAMSPFHQGLITAGQVEGLYALALTHYNAGQYEDAETLFQMLCFYKNDDSRFWMGLAGCRQALGMLPAAAEAYAVAACTEKFTSPQPLLFMALCFLRAGLREEAEATLRGLLVLGDPAQPAHAECHERARHLLGIVENTPGVAMV